MEKRESSQYLPCADCIAYFPRHCLHRHKKTCPEASNKSKGVRHQAASLALLAKSGKYSKMVHQIVCGMVQDDLCNAIRSDDLICKLGEYYTTGLNNIRQRHDVSQKMREVARLLIQARGLDKSIRQSEDLIDPQKHAVVIEAVHTCAGFDGETHNFEIPSLALKLSRMADICLEDAIEQQDLPLQKRVRDFKALQQLKWKKTVAKIKEKGMTKETWTELCKGTLARVILFNRRPPGEVQFLTVDTFETKQYTSANAHDEVLQSLSISEKVSADRLTVVYTRGKRDRGVPIRLDETVKADVDQLLNSRKEVGINKNNPYVFAVCNPGPEKTGDDEASTTGSLQPYSGSACIRSYGNSCGAQNPETLTATNLRKHLATMIQLLNLKETELEQLANHMGHDITVHRQYYSFPRRLFFLPK
ncbi:hypothetical protein HOLleu_43267 [Holothuria leucospilota]|uniref:Uncharacterized protein n=1 Tax=Holothuria leucospilota TaxID=206669 RepID=A0A9Q0YEL9_HOLLE|nr:hypothetical protein HOLleu_43267 [Holothuria leucospilota]